MDEMSAKDNKSANDEKSWASEASDDDEALREILSKAIPHRPVEVRQSMLEVPVRRGFEVLGNEVECLVAELALKALRRRGTEERFAKMDRGYSFADFRCPAYMVVSGKKASIPYALTTNKPWIVGRLKETMGGMPSSAEITFWYKFEKTPEGKLKDAEGEVRVTVNWDE